MAVEVPGGFARQQQGRVAHARPGDRHALFLPARELLGQVANSIFEADQLQSGENMLAALLRAQFSQQQRQFHVLKGGEHGNQIERLKDVTNVLIAPVGNFRVAEAENVLALYQQFPAGGPINRGDHVQRSGFARSRRSHQREKLSLGDVDRNIIERCYLKSITLEDLADAANLYDFCARGYVRLCDCAHDCPLILILSPSFNVEGAAVITLSPPTSPSTSAPSLR